MSLCWTGSWVQLGWRPTTRAGNGPGWWMAEAVDVTVLDWELGPAWLEADDKGRQRARVVDGDALATLLASVPRNVGDFFFQHEGQAYHMTLVPWLPLVDFTAAVAAY